MGHCAEMGDGNHYVCECAPCGCTVDPCYLGQAEKEGTVGPLVPWTVVGRPVDGRRTASGRLSAACVSSAAPKKISFDRGGPVWLPRSDVTNDRLRRGSTPPAKTKKYLKKK